MHKIFFTLFLTLLISPVSPQGSVMMVGGGSEDYSNWSDKPYKWFVEHAPNRKILVLHYSDTNTWFSGYFPWLSPCSVSNLFISSTSQANDSNVYQFILKHDGVFLRGGDQAQYVNKWKGTLTQKAIKEIFQRGGVIGGTSAGEMVLTNVSYISGSTDNGSALRQPNSSMTLVDDFLPLVADVVADCHTSERGRIGRTPVFLARYKNQSGRPVSGVAVDANTALVIEPDRTAEVMGASAVTILRWGPETIFSIEPGKAFAMNNMKFDQLLPGYKIDLNNGNITIPTSAQAWQPKDIIPPLCRIILDGSGSSTDWFASNGSLKKLISYLNNSTEKIGIFGSTSSPLTANAVLTKLQSLNQAGELLLIDNTRKNSLELSTAVSSCAAFIFAGNTLDSLAGFLDTSTSAGLAFRQKVSAGKPLLFVSEDMMLACEKVIMGLYSNLYAGYYGMLTHASGLNLLPGIQVVPRLYQNPDYSRSYDYTENRILGMFWSMGKANLPYGILIDAGAYAEFQSNSISAGSVSATSTPILIFDYREGSRIDYPTFRRPGMQNPVHNAAFIGAKYHILRAGDERPLTSIRKNKININESFELHQNFPNPFNSGTRIRFTCNTPGKYALTIFNSLGQRVAELNYFADTAGSYELEWNATGFASGIYYVSMQGPGEFKTTKATKAALLK